jgi:glyoxylase-like metal-dependent hydrolase (beta-lactamase superfamily II)
MVYFPPEQILFAGDLVFSQSYPYAGDPTNDPQQWMKVFEEILEMPLKRIIPGHGPLCDKEEIRCHLSYFVELEAWVRRKLADNLSLKELLRQVEDGPKYPYKLKAERRLESTITRWYQFYLKKK